ncbi:hypothetical protein J3A83DRAFT_4356841 [Scleroderma citrinum]
MTEPGEGNIKVVVRCRPLNARELARGAKMLIRMQGNQTFLDPPESGSSQDTKRATERKTMAFSFDKSYWSAGPRDEPGYCSQQTLYDDLGKELLDHGFSGFNACILAYGQDKGIIPLTCSELFVRVTHKKSLDPNVSFTVEVSYIEIYNEKVRDLLNPKNTGNLRVREHPSLGPYVEDLSKLVVSSYDEMMTLMDEGNKARTVAATNMNETSSRSHAVFTLLLTMRRHDPDTNLDTEKVSRISLVDLAGSERANSTGATGQRLKEGANINKSLTTLGKVISSLALASQDGIKKGKKKGDEFIPYRDSVLTWLLKDSLGGNSKTAMIAAISPADYEETLSTLRYADQAKKIKNKAVVNEDPNAKLVRELKEELELLRARVSGSSGEDTFDPTVPPERQKVTYQTKDGKIKTVTKAELQEQMETSEKLMQSLNETWEEKMARTQEVQKEREKALEELGITVEKNNVGVHTPKKVELSLHLLDNDDLHPLMSECLIYQLKPGTTLVGRMDSEKPAAIRLSGENILEEHCVFENTDDKVTLYAMPNSVTVSSTTTATPYKLRSGYRIILGDYHVFRFNNPEEVRKKRDRATARSNLQHSIAASEAVVGDAIPALPKESRPPSRSSSSADEADVDWNFAKREAALARLGLDPTLDNLPDEDINKLFERIAKVKTMRDHNLKSRPESSLSHRDDLWSESGRPISSETDDTSVDAGPSHGSPDTDGPLKDVQLQLESRLQAISESSEAEDLKVEKDHMEHQLKLVQQQLRRLIHARARGEDEDEVIEFESVIYTAKQLRLIRKVLDKWRAHRSFSMAETVLTNAVLVKEATVISKELGKSVSYNFTIASGGALAAPTSGVDSIGSLDSFGNVADPRLASSTQPSVTVKVLDKKHCAIYTWSLDRLQQQLQRMRNLTTYIDRPSFTHHFSSDEPFYDLPPPQFSFIGNALVSLVPLSRRLSSTSVVPIFCRYTAEAIGSCRVDIKISSVIQASSKHGYRPASPVPPHLPPGSKISFFLTVDSVKGLSSHDFAALHLQLRLSSFVGPSSTSDEVFTSSVLDTEASSLSELKYRRTFSFVASSKVIAHLRQGYAPIEFFAATKSTYLERLERWDEMRELRGNPRPPSPGSQNDSASSSVQLMRRSETDFVIEQTHDVAARIQVRELGADGEYTPVPVVSQGVLDPGAFFLHQGLQRRIVVELSSDSGAQFPWTDFIKVRVGNVRLLDPKGRIHDSTSKAMVTLPLLADQTVKFKPDGTGLLTAQALWDSSVHDSLLLNRVTSNPYRVILQVSWAIAVETCNEPVQFSIDIAVTMQTRDAHPPSRFLTFLSSGKILSRISSIFKVRLSPPLTRSPRDLWRLDTSEKYVRGEEVLHSWKPRGISAVEDYNRLILTERRAADVQAVRIILASSSSMSRALPSGSEWASDVLLRKTIELWQKRLGHQGEIVLSQVSLDTDKSVSAIRATTGREPVGALKFNSTVALIPCRQRGHLMILTDANQDIWERRWFVLRRPYLHIYTNSKEVDEVGIISLHGTNIECDSNKEALLGKPFCFTLFTAANSHAFAAPSLKELQSWTSKLDPTGSLV